MIIIPRAEYGTEDLKALQERLEGMGITTHQSGCTERPVLLAPGVPAGRDLVRSLKALGEIEQIIPDTGDPIELMSRRTFLDYALGTAGVVAVGMTAWGAVAYSRPPRQPRQREEEIVVSLNRLTRSDAVTVDSGAGPVILVRAKGRYYALAAICTHRWTCQVQWSVQRQQLVCPCHNGTFDVRGNVLSGPPPRPLQSYRVAVIDGKAHIRR